MLKIIADLNQDGKLHENCLLVSFDVVNIFHSINNKMGIESVKNILYCRCYDNIQSAECVTEASKLCLNYSKSVFNNQHYLQVDGTAQGLHMSCSYCDIVMSSYGLKAFSYIPTIFEAFS